jgi:hypothetical protein
VRGGTIGRCRDSKTASIGCGTVNAFEARTAFKPGIETMGIELLIVGVSVACFGLCALFVRICDRI